MEFATSAYSKIALLTAEAVKYCYVNQDTNGFFQFEIIINVLVSSFCFI